MKAIRMRERVRADRVPFFDDPSRNLGMRFDALADDEERRVRSMFREKREHARSQIRIGPIVERECHAGRRRTPHAAYEQLGARRNDAPREKGRDRGERDRDSTRAHATAKKQGLDDDEDRPYQLDDVSAEHLDVWYKRGVDPRNPDDKRPLVVIVGGGFGGLAAAKALADAPVRVLLLDRTNHHLFQPLLYQVATAQLSPADIAKPLRSILRDQKNAAVWMSSVKEIDIEAREVVTNARRIRYDFLILACGARHSYFGHAEWESHAPGLKSLADALEVRRRVITAFEQAEKYEDEEKRKSALTFVVVGAGPTGVETAGAIAELAHTTLKADFRNIDPPRQTRVILVEAGPRVLPSYTADLSESARKQLEKKMHVEVRLSTRVTGVGDRHVELDGERLAAHTVIWAAGNEASPLTRRLGADVDRMGRVVVNQDLTIPGYPEVQAIGDMVLVKDKTGRDVPGVAPAAMQMGRHAAKNVLCKIRGKDPKPFWYLDKGSLATIGRNAGIADVKGLRFGGWFAWVAWALIHLFFLVGFRNRTLVFLEWAWAYVFYTRAVRLITEPTEPKAVS
jgi:NADH:ubiquinone reductase (H+-translocating)